MITFFTIPLPFEGRRDSIQRNGILSWTFLDSEIYFVGRDEGVERVANEFDAISLPVERNSHGTPLVNDAFRRVMDDTDNDILLYTNPDCIYMRNLEPAVEYVEQTFDEFLIVTQRWDLGVKGYIEYGEGWERWMLNAVKEHGHLHQPVGIDCFVFRGDFFYDMPPFAVGRSAYDNWMIWKALGVGVPVIDATHDVVVVHQAHDHAGRLNSPETAHNRELMVRDTGRRIYGTFDADWLLANGELIKK